MMSSMTGDLPDTKYTQYAFTRATHKSLTGMVMRDMPMRKPDNSLLPLRGKRTSPTFVINYENHTRSQDSDTADNVDNVGQRVRLFSISSSPKSANSSRLSERSITPPFTPLAEVKGQATRSFLLRRPSEHYLEVLGDYKGTQTLPKISPPKCLPPLRSSSQDCDLTNRLNEELEPPIAFEGNFTGGNISRNVLSPRAMDSDTSRLFHISDARKECITPSPPNGKILQKRHSLPVIRSNSTGLTSVEDKLNMSALNAFPNPRTITVGTENGNNTMFAFEEDFVEQECDAANEDLDDPQRGVENFARICHWLKECEKAKVT